MAASLKNRLNSVNILEASNKRRRKEIRKIVKILKQVIKVKRKEEYERTKPSKQDVIEKRLEGMRKFNQENFGVNSSSPFCRPDVRVKSQKTFKERYGVSNFMSTTAFYEARAEYWSNEDNAIYARKRMNESIIEKYGSFAEYERFKASQRTKNRTAIVAKDGTKLDSKYEVLVWNYCIKNCIPIARGPLLEYDYNDKNHVTMIDFEIDGVLVEVKGAHLLMGVYDDVGVPINVKLQLYARNDVSVVTNDSMRPIFNGSLRGIDIRLFEGNNDASLWSRIKTINSGFIDAEVLQKDLT
jgi:hypothetical protein